MIDCARPVFIVGSARASSFRKRAEKSHVGFTPNAIAGIEPQC